MLPYAPNFRYFPIFAGSLPIHHIWQVPGCNIKTQKYSAECHIAHCRQQEWDIWSETLFCTIRGPSLNELLVDCGRMKVSHRRHKKDGGFGISVFSFVVSSAFPHCTNTWTSQELQFTLYHCYASLVSCHYPIKLGPAAVDDLQRVHLGSLHGVGTQGDAQGTFVLYLTLWVGLGTCSSFLCFYRPHLSSKNESARYVHNTKNISSVF